MVRVLRVAQAGLMCVVLVFGFTGRVQADSCSLLTSAEIQAAVGQEAGEGKLNTRANPLVGQPCQYKVGAYGVFSILAKETVSGETADSTKAELEKYNVEVSEASGIGDSSFFSKPGYGMIQLNTFQGDKNLIITLLVPGATEADQKTAAEALMRMVLDRI